MNYGTYEEDGVDVEIPAWKIIPMKHALLCVVYGEPPAYNEFVSKRWYEDGSTIHFMLDSHHFISRSPYAMVRVREMPDEKRLRSSFEVPPDEFLKSRPGNREAICSPLPKNIAQKCVSTVEFTHGS